MSFGVSSMVAPLRRVAMRRPGRATLEADPALWHYAGRLDARKLVHQYDAFMRHVANSGTEIDWIPDAEDGLADSIFVFDPSFMTSWGAILLRPGKKLRRPEVNLHEGFYERQRVPVIGAIEPPGTAEGGDLLWLDEGTLVVGRGFRTNQAGIDQIRTLLEPRGVQVHAFDLPSWQGRAACLHLLSLISPLDRDLALVYPPLLPVALYQFMRERGIKCLEAGDREFLVVARAEPERACAGAPKVCGRGGLSRDVATNEGCGVPGDLLRRECAVHPLRGWSDVHDVAGLARVRGICLPHPVTIGGQILTP